MKIFAICVVKNEGDIIKSNLLSARTWADKIFVLDNGSTDGTWEIIKSLEDDVVIPWKQDFQPFYEGIRATVYNNFKHYSSPGDWWCFRLDADEFYKDDPKTFLKSIPFFYGQVFKRSIDFVLTKETFLLHNVAEFDINNNSFRFIRKNAWCELRFFRQTKRTYWPNDKVIPKGLKAVFHKKINVLHYQYRFMEQIQKRVTTRLNGKNGSTPLDNEPLWRHITKTSAEDYIMDEKDVLPYDANGVLPTLKDINGKPYPTILHKGYNVFKSLLNLE